MDGDFQKSEEGEGARDGKAGEREGDETQDADGKEDECGES